MRGPRVQKPCAATAWHWRLEDGTEVSLVATSPALVQQIDETWPAQRVLDDYAKDWRWADLLSDCRESFALVTVPTGTPVAIYGARHSTPLKLPDGPRYRLDYIEAAPTKRRTGAGALMRAIAALRAREVGGAGIVATSFDIDWLVKFYQAAGAKLECARGWNVPPGVIPLHFDATACSDLEAVVHAERVDQRTA